MRHIVFTALLFITAAPLFSQEDCDVFNIQELSAAYLNVQVETIILQPDGSYEVQLSNGTTFIQVLGCTDPSYAEYDATANTDDGSCATSCARPTMDGHTYSVVVIGDQCWFSENLRTTVYADDSAIPEVTGNSAWYGLNTGARCDYQNDAANVSTYGRLYNLYAVKNGSGLCPSGWHVPTDGEWTELENYISSQGFSGTEGTALKSTAGWSGGDCLTDDFGFSALPGGYRDIYLGNFNDAGYYGSWWSSSPYGGSGWVRALYYHLPDVSRGAGSAREGKSVRCLRGNAILGCMAPSYIEFDATANTDDGSCATLVVNGCMDPAYVEYDATANTDNGSCATLVVNGCMDPAYVEYDATANTDDGSCATLTCANAGPTMDGYSYSTVLIGDQCWFSENLRTTVYADDSAIPEETDNSSWGSLSTDARCDYDNDADNVATYGRLYNWYAASDAAGLCPSGWHVPTDGEWTELENYISSQGFSGTEGTALKSTTGWYVGGSDNFGFSALPGGYRNSAGSFKRGESYGLWWSSSLNGGYPPYRQLKDSPDFGQLNGNLRAGLSVRCLRDAD